MCVVTVAFCFQRSFLKCRRNRQKKPLKCWTSQKKMVMLKYRKAKLHITLSLCCHNVTFYCFVSYRIGRCRKTWAKFYPSSGNAPVGAQREFIVCAGGVCCLTWACVCISGYCEDWWAPGGTQRAKSGGSQKRKCWKYTCWGERWYINMCTTVNIHRMYAYAHQRL